LFGQRVEAVTHTAEVLSFVQNLGYRHVPPDLPDCPCNGTFCSLTETSLTRTPQWPGSLRDACAFADEGPFSGPALATFFCKTLTEMLREEALSVGLQQNPKMYAVVLTRRSVEGKSAEKPIRKYYEIPNRLYC
jgi:hypothetical protein